MNIGTVATQSGVPPKTIRYYESVGLIPSPARAANGYRTYGDIDVQTLRFIHRARGLGFSVGDVAGLLALWRDKTRASADIKALVLRQIGTLDRKVQALETMRRVLLDLAEKCHGDDRPECPILDELARE